MNFVAGFRSLAFSHAVALVATALPFLMGCATGATVEGMSAQPKSSAKTNEKLRNSLVVSSVEGGKETNALWSSQISNENFKEALSQSLRNSGLEAESVEKARYVLTAILKDVDQPWIGFNMTVQTVIGYVLTDKVTNKPVASEDITAAHTAKFDEALYGPTRLRLANEGSAKQNITQWIASLQQVDPDKVATAIK